MLALQSCTTLLSERFSLYHKDSTLPCGRVWSSVKAHAIQGPVFCTELFPHLILISPCPCHGLLTSFSPSVRD
uniref:Uncharacterized protein n=1 Tax=Knipowitschia caucasica TaxID=637954 RepID=A0AAV2JAK7_KNICA